MRFDSLIAPPAALILLAACHPFDSSLDSLPAVYPEPGVSPIASFEASLDMSSKTFRVHSFSESSRGLFTVSELAVERDGQANHGQADTVELVTQNVGQCNGQPAFSFGGNVTINSFYAEPITNLFVQLTDISPPLSADAMSHASIPGFDNTLGIWFYGTPGTREWCFDVYTGGAFRIRGRVYGTLDAHAKIGMGLHGASYPGAVEIGLGDLATATQRQQFLDLYNTAGLVALDTFNTGSCCFRPADAPPGRYWDLRHVIDHGSSYGVLTPADRVSEAEACSTGYDAGALYELYLPGLGWPLGPPFVTEAIAFGGEVPGLGDGLGKCFEDRNPGLFYVQ